jgi:hypothetical protein
MVWQEFATFGSPRVRTRVCVTYVDHNILQTGFENADDHLFLQTMAAKHGGVFSRPGNGSRTSPTSSGSTCPAPIPTLSMTTRLPSSSSP